MFMWPLSSATSWEVFCRMETKKHPVNMANEKRFMLIYFWVSVAFFPGLSCLQSFSMQMEKEGLAFLTMWSSNNLQSSLPTTYQVNRRWEVLLNQIVSLLVQLTLQIQVIYTYLYLQLQNISSEDAGPTSKIPSFKA